MKIYTKTGDDGTTGLFGGARVPKASVRVEAYGTLDELNSCLGVALTKQLEPEAKPVLLRIQNLLFVIGAELACVPGKEEKLPGPLLAESDIEWIETSIDSIEKELPQLTNFVLPGGSAEAADLHLARTICRRAERAMLDVENVRPLLVVFINRLSDFLFVAARFENFKKNVADIPWLPRKS